MGKNVDIIVGGQYGSEAKGLAAYYLAKNRPYDILVCVNSAQAGHTAPVTDSAGNIIRYVSSRQLPSSCLSNHLAPIYIGPGAVINVEVLLEEIGELEGLGVPVQDRLIISDVASVITPEMFKYARSHAMEKVRAMRDGLDLEDFDKGSFASTKEGVSQALSARASRTCPIVRDFANEIRQAAPGVTIHHGPFPYLSGDGNILVEGSQGYALSFFHRYYPKCTSRDSTAAGFMSMAGLPPRDVRHIYGIYRTYPIRVAGNSGPLYNELTWKDVTVRSGLIWDGSLPNGKVVVDEASGDFYGNLTEQTTVTKRIRRVGSWDQELFEESVLVNGVDRVILTFINYINCNDEGVTKFSELSEDSRRFIDSVEGKAGLKVWAVSTSKEGGWIHPHDQPSRRKNEKVEGIPI